MRGNPESHEFIAPANLNQALSEVNRAPGQWTFMAGGTELMVAYAAGRLQAPKLMSISGLSELNFIRADENWVSIGAGVTFGQLRRNGNIQSEFPLMARAASWIGSIANQSRATLAGNIVNGSPAADAPPALLVYDADIELVSQAGHRRMSYSDFHLGYKQSALRQDELVLALHLPRRFHNHHQYLRKVGARKAMAITKIALAGCAAVDCQQCVSEVRLAAASLADRPIRLLATEAVLLGQALSPALVASARRALMEEVRPIDDIRSTADYRRSVAANLLEEFLSQFPDKPSETKA